MARSIKNQVKIDSSDPVNYPDKRIKNNDGSDNGTPVNEMVYGDIHQFFLKLMREQGILYNGLPDNVENDYQLYKALTSTANKNNFLYNLTVSGSNMLLPLKVGKLLDNEIIRCVAGFDYVDQTSIRGSDNISKVSSVSSNFKTGDHLILIFSAANVLVLRDINILNLLTAGKEVGLLTTATELEEYAGTSQIVGTTPLTNGLAFARRVIGLDSSIFLATLLRNGLYPKEHFSIVQNLAQSPVRNIGSVSGVDVGSVPIGTTYAVSGDIVSATFTTYGGSSSGIIRVVLANSMTNSNYFVRSFLEGQGSNILANVTIGSLIFKPINATTFDFAIREFEGGIQNLKIHFEVVKI